MIRPTTESDFSKKQLLRALQAVRPTYSRKKLLSDLDRHCLDMGGMFNDFAPTSVKITLPVVLVYDGSASKQDPVKDVRCDFLKDAIKRLGDKAARSWVRCVGLTKLGRWAGYVTCGQGGDFVRSDDSTSTT